VKRERRGGEGKKGREKEGRGREWRVKMCCPMSNKLSPPMMEGRGREENEGNGRFACGHTNPSLLPAPVQRDTSIEAVKSHSVCCLYTHLMPQMLLHY